MAWSSLLLLMTITLQLSQFMMNIEASHNVGVCLGMMASDLPPADAIVALYIEYGIDSMRLLEPNPEILQALNGSGISLSLGIREDQVENIASSLDGANSWFAANVEPYLDYIPFQYITVGNEIVPSDLASFVAPALKNLQSILDGRGIIGLTLTTVVAPTVLGTSSPPSASIFSDAARGPMIDILNFLSNLSNPLMINAYPYLAFASDPVNTPLDYALFTAPGPVLKDGNLSYQNLFEAIVDGFFWAMEKVGAGNVTVAISETGWPSAGRGYLATPGLAATYNNNFLKYGAHGTPKRPHAYIHSYIFAMFNEGLKSPDVEQHWGLFYPTMDPVYNVTFNP